MNKLLAILFIFSLRAYAAIALINQGSGGLGVTCSATSGTTITCTLSQAAVPGDTLIAYVSYNNVLTVSSISGGGVTWALTGASNTQANADDEIWHGLNSSGSGTTITITMSGTITVGTARATVVEFSSVGALDITGTTNNGVTSAITTATITPTSSLNEVIVASYKGNGFVSGPTNSFIALNTLNTSFQPAYILAASTSGSYSTSWTASTGGWNSLIASFSASRGAAATNNRTLLGVGQ